MLQTAGSEDCIVNTTNLLEVLHVQLLRSTLLFCIINIKAYELFIRIMIQIW